MQTTPPSLSHFLIFNPALKPDNPQQDVSPSPTGDPGEDSERAQQMKDDANDAAQLLFYTSRSSRTVSRETMLKQLRLIKGLMGFTDMVIPSDQSIKLGSASSAMENRSDPALSIRTAKSRMIVHSPEKDFYIYTNITLSTTTGEDGKVEPAYNAQGLSDQTLVRALAQGYDDFKLLHGTLGDLLPPSSTLASTLEKYWTRFAFAFENEIISAPPTLFTYIPSLVSASGPVQQGAARALEVFIEDIDLPSGTDFGLISHLGPLHTTLSAPALERYLVGVVSASLPLPEVVKPDARAALGIGRKDHKESRTSSWSMGGLGTWVPNIPGVTSRSVTPASPGKDAGMKVRTVDPVSPGPGTKDKSRWGLGMPSLGLGEAMGTVGGVLGLGLGGGTKAGPVTAITRSTVAVNKTTSVPSRPSSIASSSRVLPPSNTAGTSGNLPSESVAGIETSIQAEEAIESRLASVTLDDTASIISPTVIDVEDLQDAVEPSAEIDLGWDKRTVHVERNGALEQRRLSWIIRDNVLLYILHPTSTQPPYTLPHSSPVLALYSKLSSILSPERGSFESSRTATNHSTTSTVVVTDDTIEKTGDFDPATAASLADIKDMMGTDRSMNEVYAKTPLAKFIVSKRLEGNRDSPVRVGESHEVHMVVSRKDANLTDAEHAMRAFLRTRQS